MAKAIKKSAPKPKKRAKKYEEKVRVDGTFSELIGKLFPKAKSNRNKTLPKLKGGSKK